MSEDVVTEEYFDVSKVTRFELIDGDGRRIVEYGVHVDLSMQDEGRTLKVFLKVRK